MKSTLLSVFASLSISIFAIAAENKAYPIGPHPELTPGSLCMRANRMRYPERIPYCDRNVDSGTKRRIFEIYDSTLGYQTQKMNRQKFKIDHYIPLCMGGSNEIDNLWPQHESVYAYTDSVEAIACIKLSEGKIKQQTAIELIRRAKAHLNEASQIVNHLNQI